MTAREKAIDAGLEAAENDTRWKFGIYPTGWAEVEDVLTIAAPHIESALLDRIEKVARSMVEIAREQADEYGNYVTGPDGVSGEYKEGRADGLFEAEDALRAVLTEIRQGLGPAQSPDTAR